MVAEDLSETERIKVLLGKKSEDQQAYFFTNIENIFSLNKDQFHNIYGPEAKSKHKYNYET